MSDKQPIRIAVTGIGLVTPLGLDAQSTWQALLDKKNGISHIETFDASGFSTQIAAEIKNFRPAELIKSKNILSYATRSTQFASIAAEAALIDAGIRPQASTNKRWGLVLGSSMMAEEFDYMCGFHHRFAEQGKLDVTELAKHGLAYSPPKDYCKMQSNTAIGLLTQEFGIQGYTLSVHTACSSGGQALGLGLQAIRRGDADYILAGGFDSMISPLGLSGFGLLGALSTENSSPATASRPFDRSRNGFVLGEGAGFLVLERWDQAQARGARIYAEFAGEGNSLSSYRITDPHPSGDGAIQAIRAALRDAHITADNVDYINAHGTSTKMNDLCETNAIKAVFGERAKQIPISSTKSQLGHLISAAGAIEGAICALAIHHRKIPMTANLKNPDPDCDLDFVSEGPRSKAVQFALSNSFGFGGTNNCLVFKHPGIEP